MAPIKVGFFGLSPTKSAWAVGAHLGFLKKSPLYEIVAVCNSTKESGEAAIKKFELPASTKAYSSPEELAADPEIELVVVSVRVDKHYQLVKPAIEKGKACFVEWPLAKNLAQAEELLALAEKHKIKTVTGFQGRHSPVFNKVKQLIENGRIGKLFSSTVTAVVEHMGETVSEGVKYLNDASVGGNLSSIHFGHLIDYTLYSLGELASYSGVVETLRKEIKVLNAEKEVIGTVTRDTPDNFTLAGKLKNGGVLSVHMRDGKPFKGSPSINWEIFGDKGTIQVTADSTWIHLGYTTATIKLHDQKTDTVETIDYSDLLHHQDLESPTGRNVAGIYEAFAEGRTDGFANWREAVERHRLLKSLEESSATGQAVRVS